ncbi:phosphatidylglycerophosphatase A [candidate division WOR-3 bacterium]|nr:phosphatidylglycerophosphatase A [candidate division WOR-3 bacterium]
MSGKAGKWFEIIIGTGFFTGYLPIAPATCCSGLTLIIFYFLPKTILLQTLIILFLFFYGVYISGKLERNWGEVDPKRVVIDEMCGMFLSLYLLPWSWRIGIIGFLLFRFFDIIKPFPIRQTQKISRGWGIMIDDVIAALFTNIVLRIVIHFFPKYLCVG